MVRMMVHLESIQQTLDSKCKYIIDLAAILFISVIDRLFLREYQAENLSNVLIYSDLLGNFQITSW